MTDIAEDKDLTQAQLQRRKQEKKQKSEAVIRKNIQALSERMGALVNCDKYSDVTFNVGPHPGTPIKGHKAILATCSAKFEELFEDGATEVSLHDVKRENFLQMLQFIYTGRVKKITSSNVLELLNIADRFEVKGLISICLDKYIRKMVTNNNAFDLFEDTWKNHKQQLSYECLFFIEKNFSNLLKMNRDGFNALSVGPLLEILQSDNLSLSDEYVLFLAVKGWVEAQLSRDSKYSTLPKESDEYKQTLRNSLAPLLEHVRFPMMSQQGLAEAEKSGLIPHHLLFEAFRHHVLVRDQKLHEPRDDTTGSPLLVLDPENNPRARRRNYKTYFLWDSGWHGLHIQIEDEGRTVRKIKSGWFSIALGSTGFSSGLHYWEIKVNGNEFHIGVAQKSLPSNQLDNYLGSTTDAWAYESTGFKKHGARQSFGDPFSIDDVVGVLLDMDEGKLSYFKNGKSLGVAFTDLPCGTPVYPAIGWRDGTATIVPAWCCSLEL